MSIRHDEIEKGFVIKNGKVICDDCKGNCGQCNNSLYMAWVNGDMDENHWYAQMRAENAAAKGLSFCKIRPRLTPHATSSQNGGVLAYMKVFANLLKLK